MVAVIINKEFLIYKEEMRMPLLIYILHIAKRGPQTIMVSNSNRYSFGNNKDLQKYQRTLSTLGTLLKIIKENKTLVNIAEIKMLTLTGTVVDLEIYL